MKARKGRFLSYWLVVAITASLMVFNASPAWAVTPDVFFVATASGVGEGNTTHTVTVQLNAVGADPLVGAVTVNLTDAGTGSATSGSDYSFAAQEVTFDALSMDGDPQTVDVVIFDDATDENPETIDLQIVSAGDPDRVGSPSQHTVTITDDDPLPALSIGDASATEGSAVGFTVTLSEASAKTVTVDWATSTGSAGGGDFGGGSGTLTFNPGATSQPINVTTAQDSIDEPNESFSVDLSSAVNATGSPSATGTILDDDAAPAISIANDSGTEGTQLTFDVTLSNPSSSTVTVDWATSPGTAGGGDFSGGGGQVTFGPGDVSQPVVVQTTQDALNEATETFTVGLSSPVNATILDGSATGTINDNDGAPTLSIGNASNTEGSAIGFTVTLSPASGQTVTVNWSTSNGTAVAGVDYTSGSGTLTFNPGQTSQPINISTTPDTTDEPNETFQVNLSSPVNASGTPSATGTITDDDSGPAISIADTAATEGTNSTIGFTVSLSALSGQTVAVNWATANGSAVAGSDYTAASGTVTFTPGDVSETVTVTLVNDGLDEALTEMFTVTLSTPSNATIVDGTATGTITDDDPFPIVTIGPDSATEGSSVVFPVTLSSPSGRTATVTWTATAGTATSPSDYTTTTGTVTFAAGVTAGTISVTTVGDSLDEANETFTVTLTTGGANPFLTPGTPSSATGTINDNDGAPGLSVNDVAGVSEGAGSIIFTINLLPAASGQSVTVNYTTGSGTALAGTDFTTTSGSVTFTAGAVSRSVSVPIMNDTVDEGAETLTLTISNASPTEFLIIDATAIGIITDNDNAPPELVIRTVSAGGIQKPIFLPMEPVTLSGTISDAPGDTHIATVNWGDGSAEETWPVTPGTTTFNRNHAFAAVGTYSITATVADGDGGVQSGVRQVIITTVAPDPETLGLVNTESGGWHLRDLAGNVNSFFFGNPGDYPLVGDWNCDGVDTPGMYRQGDGFVYLRNSNTQGIADIRFFFGNPGDVPLAGDFDGDGCDTVSIYRPSQGQIFIINELGQNEGGLGAAEYSFYFGNPGDKPFVGDFDGNGVDTIGLHRETSGLVYFRLTNTQGSADNQFIFGDPGDRFVAGDWLGSGIDAAGLFRPTDQTFYLRYTNTQGTADETLQWGGASWLPVAGVFNP